MLPIAEKFISIQGEGQFTGTSMFFIRLAGCSVGRGTWPFTCTAWNGRKFQCDTDYRKKEESSVSDLMTEIRATKLQHVCITGGEPLMHEDTWNLLHSISKADITSHIETSGTIEAQWGRLVPQIHLTVAPEEGYKLITLARADEIKILVGDDVTAKSILQDFEVWADKIWIQPINNYDTLNRENVDRCLRIIEEEPKFRLSIQLHKVIGVR